MWILSQLSPGQTPFTGLLGATLSHVAPACCPPSSVDPWTQSTREYQVCKPKQWWPHSRLWWETRTMWYSTHYGIRRRTRRRSERLSRRTTQLVPAEHGTLQLVLAEYRMLEDGHGVERWQEFTITLQAWYNADIDYMSQAQSIQKICQTFRDARETAETDYVTCYLVYGQKPPHLWGNSHGYWWSF